MKKALIVALILAATFASAATVTITIPAHKVAPLVEALQAQHPEMDWSTPTAKLASAKLLILGWLKEQELNHRRDLIHQAAMNAAMTNTVDSGLAE